MDQTNEIPCVACKFWNGKRKKLSCNPQKCTDISTWLLEHIPQISDETFHMQGHLPEIAIQYVV